METQNIYQKLFEARKYIKTCGIEKKGRNEYSKYDYFTPEQVSQLVFEASENQKILPLFSLKKNEYGHFGELKVVNLENIEDVAIFSMSTDIPNIKATNITQQVGGAVTYTERYLLMTAFDIKDNNLDFDSKDQRNIEKEEPEKWLNKWLDKAKTKEDPYYFKVVKNAKENGKGISDLRKIFKISKEVAAELETDLK